MPRDASMPIITACTRFWRPKLQSEDRLPEAEQEYKLALSNLPASVPEGPLYPIELAPESLRNLRSARRRRARQSSNCRRLRRRFSR